MRFFLVEVNFFIFGRGETCTNEKHIYWDTRKFWNIDLEEWDAYGTYQKKEISQEKVKTTLRKQCRIQPQYHKNKCGQKYFCLMSLYVPIAPM